jgi:hypothetical protein
MDGDGLEAFLVVVPLAAILLKRRDTTLFSARMKQA